MAASPRTWLRGEKLFQEIGCVSCHTPDWHLFARNPGAKDYTERYDGDRRFFELEVAYNDKTDRLEGKVRYLADRSGNRWLPRRQAYTVRGIYSDFKYHDVGPRLLSDAVRRQHRPAMANDTAVGRGHARLRTAMTAPVSISTAVIRRHGGEALAARNAYLTLGDEERRQVVCFLQSLVLYQTDQLALRHGRRRQDCGAFSRSRHGHRAGAFQPRVAVPGARQDRRPDQECSPARISSRLP